MLKNYLILTFKQLSNNRFYTFIMLLGISITIFFVCIGIWLVDIFAGANPPSVHRARTLSLQEIQIRDDQGSSPEQLYPSYYFMENYVMPLTIPEKISLFAHGHFPTIAGKEILNFSVHYTDENYWDIMKFQFLKGKPYRKQEIQNGAQVMVITKEIKEILFGKEKDAIGKAVGTKGAEYKVIGVVENFPVSPHLKYTSMWIPYTAINNEIRRQPIQLDDKLLGYRGFESGFSALVLAKGKKDFQKIRNEFKKGLQNLQSESFEYKPEQIEAKLLTAREELGNETEFVELVLLLIVLFMILPALNLMNLNFNRFYERYEEIGIRKSFGAANRSVAFQFLFEVVIISMIGGIIGYLLLLMFADNIVDYMNIYKPGIKIPHGQFQVNIRVISYTLLAILFFAVISSVIPAIRVSRLSINNTLKGGEV